MTSAPVLLGDAALAARAAYVLRDNDLGTMTAAAPRLYPHMWSWDAAFIAIGLARVSPQRAITELDTILAAQWPGGMIPHIRYSPDAGGYFPDAARWGTAGVDGRGPGLPDTSGICQPPVHAIAAGRIVDAARARGGAERRAAEEFLDRAWTPLVRWHRWLAEQRDPDATGRVTIHHGWESGTDNSPRWDGPYGRVEVGAGLPPYERKDTLVADPAHRPTDTEYDRYLWLIEEMRRAGYDQARLRDTASFAVQDVLTSAILAVACDVLADLGDGDPDRAADVAELRTWAARFRAGVAGSVDPGSGLARDRDLRTGEWLGTETLAGFAPLLCGGLDPAAERAMLELLSSPRWCGHPALHAPVLPSTSPESPAFRAQQYWRGPQWPVMVWMYSWALERRGHTGQAAALRTGGLDLLRDGTFAEYYDPLTGAPLGSLNQSWTAAAALDWLSI
ncbi:glycogen debranching protein [Pseudonocardia nematodicida]|uniref:Glycogen debranching protein n=1 Tax=Pseudonocardia nematodicida TaxID=1206997 RepID=A0ABV1K5T7_9PSEU